MRIIETKLYNIEEHPDKDKCYEWIRNHWFRLNEQSVDDIIESIKALSDRIGGTNDYAISQVPSRGEHIGFFDYNTHLLSELNADDYPLTGVCWDKDLIEGLRRGHPEEVLETLHKDTEYMYSDEGLFELCQMNDYEFDENGKLWQ